MAESPVAVRRWRAPADTTRVVGRRAAQCAIDLVVSSIIPVASTGLFLLVPVSPDGETISVPAFAAAAVAVTAIAVGVHSWYWVIRPAGERGQTWGMRLLGIRVVQTNGLPVTTRALAVRWVMLLVDGIGLGLVGLVAMLASPSRQRLGDRAAGTVVVRDTP